MNKEELAQIFYNDMVEKGDDSYDPDSKFSTILNEIEDVMQENLDFNTLSKLEGLILGLSCEEVEQHYIWGFCTGVEVARVVLDSSDDKLLQIALQPAVEE